ncbi:hypothetical protein BJ944DRAFT_288423 [Cunninghamella echinulata]|nr:hypothetical protein BJ944DRAFT_288423 [Cunninghamella echinulata]
MYKTFFLLLSFLFFYLFQNTTSQEIPLILPQTPTSIAPSFCLSLQNSLACPAFQQFYISTGVVDRYPFLPNNITTIQDFDNSLFRYVNSTSNYLLQLGCLSTNYNPLVPYARYSLTKMCARLIQDPEDSLPCNTNHHLTPPPLCQQTCLDWVESVTAITAQPNVCSHNLQRSEAITNYTIHCHSWQGFNATIDDNCISGIANEPENCGFRENNSACQFCKNTTNSANNNCCETVVCHGGISIGTIVGISLGSLIGIGIFTTCCFFICSKKRKKALKSTLFKPFPFLRSSSSNIALSKNKRHNNQEEDEIDQVNIEINNKKGIKKKKNEQQIEYNQKDEEKKERINLHDNEKDDSNDKYTIKKKEWITSSDDLTILPSTLTIDHPSSSSLTITTPIDYSQSDNIFDVIHTYSPRMEDELSLNIGDMILRVLPFDDGWALGVNLATGLKGAFPLVCVSTTPVSLMNQWHSLPNGVVPPIRMASYKLPASPTSTLFNDSTL